MDEGLTFLRLSIANRKRSGATAYHPSDMAHPPDWGHAADCADIMASKSKGLSGKLRVVDDGDDQLADHFMERLADVVILADMLATALHRDLGEAVREKFNAFSERNGDGFRI